MKTKTKSNLLITFLTLAMITGFFGFTVGIVSATPEHAIIEVTPTGDVNYDGDKIQAAIDRAHPGDEIILKAGTFMLGKYLAVDDSLVSTSRGSFLYTTDTYPFGVRDPNINPSFYERGGYEETSTPFPQCIVVDKPLIIRGENLADSGNPTVITVANTWLETASETLTGYNNGMGGLYADSNLFILASPDITIRNLRFYSMIQGINIISAGTTIEDCIFEDGGGWHVNYFFDDYAAYPNYPKYKDPVKSYLRRNQFRNVGSAIHLYGSEIMVTDNYVEIKLNILDNWLVFNHTLWGIVFGGFGEYPGATIPGIYTNSLCRNNLVKNNLFEGDENSYYGAFYFAGYGVPITENEITGNVVRNMWAMLESWGGVPVERNTITNNVAIGVGRAPLVYPYDTGYGVVLDYWLYMPTRNVISGNQFIDTLYPMTLYSGEHNQIINNDYTQTKVPGWFYWQECVFLGYLTHGNFVSEGLFPPGTTMYEQILNLGTNVIPGGGVLNNNPGLAEHLQNAHTKQREKRCF